jgi:hypothetical protein
MHAMVTAIIPNYNHEWFLQRRLDSVYGQTYPHLRVILLDDASTDASRTILERYRHHPRTQAIVYNETNSGSPFLQWKKGLDLVETDWVWIAESDDWCEPDFLESLVPALNETGTVIGYAPLHWANDAGYIIKTVPPATTQWYNGKAFVRDHLFHYNSLQNAGMLVFRKNAAMAADSRWAAMRQAGDYWLWAEIARQGRVFGSGQSACYMTKHESSVSAQWLETPTAWQEWAETAMRMKSMECISSADIRHYAQQQLTHLFCVQRAMEPHAFEQEKNRWVHWANLSGEKIHTGYARMEALKRKVLHKIQKLWKA